MRRPEFAAFAMLLCAMCPAVAEDAEDVGLAGAIELRAHRALIAKITEPGADLRPFETDGCSGGLSEVWRLVADTFPEFSATYEGIPPWESCCVTHDRAYHDAGGSRSARESFAARKRADQALRACVAETGRSRKAELAELYDVGPDSVVRAYSLIADAMHMAVRFGGGPCSGLPWRWGFGWPDCPVLQVISQE